MTQSTNQPIRRLIAFGAATLGLLLVVSIAANSEQFTIGEPQTSERRDVIASDGSESVDLTPPSFDQPSEPLAVPDAVAIVLAIVLGFALLYLLSRQRFSFRFRRPSLQITTRDAVQVSEEEQAEAIADFARDLIDELNEGDSARYAIQRAYAAVETGFGAQDLVRKPAETPLRYLDRVFGRHQKIQAPLERLTAHFQQARFSSEPVDESMRTDAIAALRELRDYYQTVAAKTTSRSRSKATT